jgi:hypothetical protein
MSLGSASEEGHPTLPLAERVSGWIAVLGGLLAVATAMLVIISVLGRWLSGMPWAQDVAGKLGFTLGPINGDFEMVQMATAVAIFAYLPYTQARRGNIYVDTFTGWLPQRSNTIIDAFWDLVYAGMMALLTWCLAVGTIEHYQSGQTTMLLQIIAWPAIAISTVLLALLTCVALSTAIARLRARP